MEKKLTATIANSFLKEKWGERETKRERWNEKGKIDKANFLQHKEEFKTFITFSGISKLPSTLNHTHYHLR